jgi:hypothetical protein
MRWVTVRKAGLDALACAWLIRRFIDRDADILFASWSGIAQAVDQGFLPFHVPGYPLAPQKGKTVSWMPLPAMSGPAGIRPPCAQRKG